MNQKNTVTKLIIGIVMLVAGAYWFLSSVRVTTGFYQVYFGGISAGGLVVIPFIAGVIWMFANHKSVGAKIVTGIGLILIFASIIGGTRFVFRNTSLYEYLIMLVFIFGGAVLVLQYVFQKNRKKK